MRQATRLIKPGYGVVRLCVGEEIEGIEALGNELRQLDREGEEFDSGSQLCDFPNGSTFAWVVQDGARGAGDYHHHHKRWSIQCHQ